MRKTSISKTWICSHVPAARGRNKGNAFHLGWSVCRLEREGLKEPPNWCVTSKSDWKPTKTGTSVDYYAVTVMEV